MSIQFAESNGSKPSMQELASFASKAKEIDIGGVDDIIDLGDDLGVNLLANPNRMSASPKPAATRQVNFGGGGGGGGEIPQIKINPVDDLEVVNLDAGPGASDIHINKSDEPAPFVIGSGSGSGSSGSGSSEFGSFGSSQESNRMSIEEENTEKQKYLTKLRRLEASDIRGVRMTMSNSLEEIKAEHDRLTDSRNLEASVRFQRNALMTFVSGVEMVNDKFGHRLPVKPRLKGWSESVHTNISDFDDIFEELYDLYKDKAKMHPLLRLAGTLGVSATMYHLTNTMAERSGIPGMADLLNENPELQRQFAQAAASRMGGLGNFMAAAGNMGPPPPPPSMQEPMSGRMPFNMGTSMPPASAPQAAAPEQPARARREMRGPSGVDDILKAFEAERLVQNAAGNPIASSRAGVFTPAGNPPSPPRRVQVLRESGGATDPMADFLAGAPPGALIGGTGSPAGTSIVDDAVSLGSGSVMTERRRGRRRAVTTPVGSTLNLNV